MDKELTILVPTYNRFMYTKYTLDALSLYTDFSCVKDVLVGDAGSTDGTRELAEQYEFVTKVYDIPHGSVARNIRKGAELATTPYVLMLCNDIIVSKDWNRSALESLKAAEEHGIKVLNYDMPDKDLDEAKSGWVTEKQQGGFEVTHGHVRPPIEHDGFSIQPTYQAGGLWITTRELLLSQTRFGKLGDMVTNVYFGWWYWHVLSFQGEVAVRLPRLACLLLEFLPDIPQGSNYMNYRLGDPLVKEFLAEEDPVALKQEYVSKGWMRDVKHQ